MAYTNNATGKTPAHIIYLLDVSGSMAENMPGTNKRKIDVVSDLLEKIAYQIYLRNSRGKVVFERYRIAIFAYNNKVIEVTNGDYISAKEFINDGVPEFSDLGNAQTNTAAAMSAVFNLLSKTVQKMQANYPVPIVCHLTDGQYTEEYGNPSALMKQILNFDTPDGKVLLENIYLGDKIFSKPNSNSKEWSGSFNVSEINDIYAKFLYDHSSVWPERYTDYFKNEYGFNIKPKTRMFFPAENVDTIELAFTASTTTPRGNDKIKESA